MNTYEPLSLATWNMRCEFDISSKYAEELSKSAHFITIQEHGLFPCEMPKLETYIKGYTGIGKPSRQLVDTEIDKRKRVGGCAILWRKTLQYKVIRYPKEGSDRICMVELKIRDLRVFIICVYLPHQTCIISDYQTELTVLRGMLDKYRALGMCLIMGDTNISFGAEYGIRCSGLSYPNVKPFMSVMNGYNMTVADIGEKGQGTLYTFTGGHGTSYLDHIIVSSENESNICSCTVLPDCPENTSDHLPILVRTNINICEGSPPPVTMSKRVAWDKLTDVEIAEAYTQPLELRCAEILRKYGYDPTFILNLPEYCNLSPEDLDNIVKDMIISMNTVGDTLICNEFNPSIKPFWNRDLSALADVRDKKRSHWRETHSDEERDNAEYDDLRDAKREYRRQRRIETRKYSVKEMNNLNEAEEIDQSYFWWLVSRNKIKIVSPILSEDGNIITDPLEIQKEWNTYYQTLYSETDIEPFDNDFRDYVVSEIPNIFDKMKDESQGKYLTGGPISNKDLESIIKKLPRKKATGYDKISSEHVIYSGVLARSTLTWLMNGMINSCVIPPRLKKGLIVSIPKPNKDCLIKENNRGLTLLPTYYKILEKLIMMRENGWIQTTIAPIQSCGKDHVSCVHTSFAVQQTVTMHINEGKTVHGGFMDTKKAFDHLWILGLLYKLHIERLNPKAWLLTYDAYKDFQCTAFVNGIQGPWFKPARGVHQGAPLSMIWYTVLINDLLKQLCNYKNGICIRNMMLSSPSHADDVSVLTIYKTGLNDMFRISHNYARKWRYSYGIDKTIYMCWGEDSSPDIPIVFGNQVLEPKDECKHMGVTLTTDRRKTIEICQKRIGSGKYALLSGLGLGGAGVRTSPNTLSKIYWGVVVPKMLYGIETTPTDEATLDLLEDNHRQNALMIQNLPTRTPKPAVTALLGWQSLRSFIAYLKVMFLLRVLCLGEESLYKKLMIISIDVFNDKGDKRTLTPVGDMLRYVKQYGLTDMVRKCRISGNWKMVESLKKNVKIIILKCDQNLWKASCLLYRCLGTYNSCVTFKKLNVWWSFVAKTSGAFKCVSSVVALLCGTQPNGYGANFGSRVRCQICGDYAVETFEHIVFDCLGLCEVRNTLLTELLETMPPAMMESFTELNNAQKLVFIISGLGSDVYVKEWQEIYLKASRLIHILFRERASKYNMFTDMANT